MEDAVSLDQIQGFGERLAVMQAEPSSGVAMPPDVEEVSLAFSRRSRSSSGCSGFITP